MAPKNNPFSSLLAQRRYITIDGALATQFEHRGCCLNTPLWSATALLSTPSLIRRVHYDYFVAGADIAITASYQVSERGLLEHRGMAAPETAKVIASSVELAMEAREEAVRSGRCEGRMLLVAGSVGPYGAYLANGSEYTGAYSLTEKEMKDFHRLRIRALVDAGADLLAIETIPSFSEVLALLSLMENEFPDTVAWLSVTPDSSGKAMADGTSLDVLGKKVLERRQQILALGVNCTPRILVSPALKTLKETVRDDIALLAYPNSGEVWDAKTKTWSGESGDGRTWDNLVAEWREEGARLVGGCCRTGPEDVEIIARALGLVEI